jgi:hypothetical protein|eukprot:SAG25_NODE_979_length_4429_cov_10.939261_4_plen_76_part_00
MKVHFFGWLMLVPNLEQEIVVTGARKPSRRIKCAFASVSCSVVKSACLCLTLLWLCIGAKACQTRQSPGFQWVRV